MVLPKTLLIEFKVNQLGSHGVRVSDRDATTASKKFLNIQLEIARVSYNS